MPQPIFGPGRSEQADSMLGRERELRAKQRAGTLSARGQSQLRGIQKRLTDTFGGVGVARKLAANARERRRIDARRNITEAQRRALRVATDRREAQLMRESARAVKKAAKKAAKKARPAKKAAKKVAKKARPVKKAAKKARPVKKAAKKANRRPR